MGREKRHNSRGSVSVDSGGTLFFLKSENGLYAITRISDISLSGAGIETRYRLEAGEPVTLKYHSRDFRISITATVAWCRQEDGICKLGIAFDPENEKKNSLFFLAMRKFLDDFDGVCIDA